MKISRDLLRRAVEALDDAWDAAGNNGGHPLARELRDATPPATVPQAAALSEAEEHRRGANVAILLGLTPHGDRFNTAWGTKTARGLYLTLARIMAGEQV